MNMETRHYWEENGHAVKYENYNSNDGFPRAPGCSEQLNFAAAPSEDEAEYQAGGYLKKGKVSRQDPMSHRIIEKRRRDRMNNCLADLSRLIPPEYLKKGRGRVEKTEIIEMAIRHLKYLQERANGLYNANNGPPNYAAERHAASGSEQYRAGYQEAASEAFKFLVDVQGYRPGDGLCVQLASHLQRHCDNIVKGEPTARDKQRSLIGSSSETNSSSSSSHGYVMKPSVIARADPPPEPQRYEPYEPPPPPDPPYPVDGERANRVQPTAEESETPMRDEEPLQLDTRRKRDTNLRTIRKGENSDDFMHSYKFKNSIERRFSRSQDCEAHDMSVIAGSAHALAKAFSHKRRRAAKLAPSTSTSNSGSTEEARDTSPQVDGNVSCTLSQQDTSSESQSQSHQHQHYDKEPSPHAQFVPIFALNSLGEYYVPLRVDYSCLARQLSPYDALDARQVRLATPLHPVTIHVNFQPCHNYRVKREITDREWRPS